MKGTRYSGLAVSALAFVLALSGLLGGARTAAAQGTSNDATLQAFADAYNSGDLAKAQTLADPNFTFVQDPRSPGAKTLSLTEFFTPPLPHVSLSNFRDTDANTVMADLVIKGNGVPPLPHPFTETDTATLSNGRIVRIAETLSAQTLQDIAALGPGPGMPTTGNADQPAIVIAALALGLLFLGLGIRLRIANAKRP